MVLTVPMASKKLYSWDSGNGLYLVLGIHVGIIDSIG